MNQTFKKYNLLLGWIFHLVLSFFIFLLLAYLAIQSWPQRIESEQLSHDITLAHLRCLSYQIRNNRAAERMQELFPEGACFTLTLSGHSWGNALPYLNDEEKQEALNEIRYTLNEQNSPSATSPFVNTEVRNGVFWLGQRNLLLGVYLRALDEETRPEDLVEEFHENSRKLAEAFHKSPTHHLDAYPSMCWPADNVTALRSIVLHDELYETDYRSAYEEWKEWTLANADPITDMPAGHLDSDDGEHYDPARGCANSWSIPLISEIDPEYAATLYKQYKTHFAIKRLGYGMLREWSAEAKGRAADVDSGPIIWGAGMTATGVGLAAARSQGDLELEADIRDLSHTLGFPDTDTINGHPATGYLFGQLPVGDAFLTWGYSIERPESTLQNAPPSRIRRILQRWPWFLILFLTTGILIAQGIYFGRRSYRKYRIFLQSQEPPPNKEEQ